PLQVVVRPWPRARRAMEPRFGVRYLVLAELSGPDAIPPLARQEILAAFALKARFGSEPTPASPGWFQGNRQIVYVLERRGVSLPESGLADHLVHHPEAADHEAETPEEAQREDRCEPAVELGNRRTRIAAQEHDIGHRGEGYARDHVGDVVLLGEQSGDSD